MHVVLICTSVIMQLHSVLSSPPITDITNDCLGHRIAPFFLTSGIGSYDNKIVMIATEQPLNCTIEYMVMNKGFVLVVIEFPDWRVNQKICIQEQSSAVTVSDFNETKTCTFNSPGPRHSVLHKTELHVNFRDLSTVNTLKIIATSLRDPGLFQCTANYEIECVFHNKMYCMNSVFECDGNVNCGVPNSYDEDLKICQGLGVTYFMIFCSIIMYVISLLLLALLFLSFSPKRKETFVYKFDHLTPLFDSESGVVTYDIDIKILFPRTEKSLPSTKSILIKK